MNTQEVLKKLFELKMILDRLAQTDTTLYEALSHDVEAAANLADECIAELTHESGAPEADEESE